MKKLLCLLAAILPLSLFGQAVSRTELKATNTAVLNATTRNNNGRSTNLTISGFTTNRSKTQFTTADTNTFQFGGNGKTLSAFDNVSGITFWSYDHSTDQLTETLGTHEVVGTIKAQNYKSANGNNGATVTGEGAVYENGLLISGIPGQNKLDSANRVMLTTGANLSAVAATNAARYARFVLSNSVITVNTNLIFSASNSFEFLDGAAMSISNTAVVEINGPIIATPSANIFSGLGTPSFSNNVSQFVYYFPWIGVTSFHADTPANVVNQSALMQKLVNAVPNYSELIFPTARNANYGGYFIISNRYGLTISGGGAVSGAGLFPVAGLGYTGPSSTNNAHRGAVIYIVDSQSCKVEGLHIDMTTPNAYTMSNVAQYAVLIDQSPSGYPRITTDIAIEEVSIRNQATNDLAKGFSISERSLNNCENIRFKNVFGYGTLHRGDFIYIGDSSNAKGITLDNVGGSGWSNEVHQMSGQLQWRGGLGGNNQWTLKIHGNVGPIVLDGLRKEALTNFIHVTGESGGLVNGSLHITHCEIAGNSWRTNSPLVQLDGYTDLHWEDNMFDHLFNQHVFGASGSGLSSSLTLSGRNGWPTNSPVHIGFHLFSRGVKGSVEDYNGAIAEIITTPLRGLDILNNRLFDLLGPYTNAIGQHGARVYGSAGVVSDSGGTFGTNVSFATTAPLYSQGSASLPAMSLRSGGIGTLFQNYDANGNTVETFSTYTGGYSRWNMLGNNANEVQISSQFPTANYFGANAAQGYQLGLGTSTPTNTLDVNGDFNVRAAAYFPVTASNNTPSSYAAFLNGKLIQTAAPVTGSGSATVPFVLVPDNGTVGSTNFNITTKSNIFRIQGISNILRFTNNCNGCEVVLYNTNDSGLGFSISNAPGSTNSIDWKTEPPPVLGGADASAPGITTIRLLCTASNILGWYEPPYGTANPTFGGLTVNGTMTINALNTSLLIVLSNRVDFLASANHQIDGNLGSDWIGTNAAAQHTALAYTNYGQLTNQKAFRVYVPGAAAGGSDYNVTNVPQAGDLIRTNGSNVLLTSAVFVVPDGEVVIFDVSLVKLNGTNVLHVTRVNQVGGSGGSSVTDAFTNRFTGAFTNLGNYVAEAYWGSTNLDLSHDVVGYTNPVGSTAIALLGSNILANRSYAVLIRNLTNDASINWPASWEWYGYKPLVAASNSMTVVFVDTYGGTTNAELDRGFSPSTGAADSAAVLSNAPSINNLKIVNATASRPAVYDTQGVLTNAPENQTVAGTGGANTNFTGQAGDAVVYIDAGTTNVNFVAIMPGITGVTYFTTYVLSNLTTTARQFSFSSVTNQLFNLQQYDGITLPVTITNKHRAVLAAMVNGSNVTWAIKQCTNGF